uniref:WD_REPEATS_REGION domain-containing protein n=1 Tax=Meloidogyne floridensis TaxID=298350 RepID=A0A915P2U2_9BILA
MKKQQKIPNTISSQRKTVESKTKGQLINQNKTGEKSDKLSKDERNNRRKSSELSAAIKDKLREDGKEERKNSKKGNEKKEHKKNNEEKIRKTTKIRDKPKVDEELNKKKEEEIVYEDDFEDYESDFEEDMEENEETRDERVEEKEEESILRKKLTGNNRINIIENERIKVDKEDINKERELLDQKEIIPQEVRFIEENGKNDQEWFVDYFKEVTGQNLHRRQVFTQTEGSELNAYSQTEFIEKETVGIQTGKYNIKATSTSQKTEDRKNAGLARFVEEAGQLLIGLLQQTTPSNLEKVSSVFSFRRLNLSLNSIFTENTDPMQNKKSFIAEFDIEATTREIGRLICCDQEIAFLRYAPDNSVLFGGLKDGSLIAWDLLKWRSSIVWETDILVNGVLVPAMNSNFIFCSISEELWKRNSNSNWADFRIVGMEVTESVGSGVLARLFSLYESGLLRVLHSVAKNDGNENKEGEGNGKIEFVVVSSTQCFRHIDGHKNHLEEFATSLAIYESNEGAVRRSECFVGTSKGRIIRLNPTNIKTSKFFYNCSSQVSQGYGSEITNIKFQRVSSHIFACTTNDQKIFIFNYNESEPIKVISSSRSTLSTGQRLMSATLFECNENIFYSINSGEQIIIWKSDLLNDVMGKTSPMNTYDFYQQYRNRIHCSTTWKSSSENGFMV